MDALEIPAGGDAGGAGEHLVCWQFWRAGVEGEEGVAPVTKILIKDFAFHLKDCMQRIFRRLRLRNLCRLIHT